MQSTDNALGGLDIISATLGAATPISAIPRPTLKEEPEQKEAPEIEDDYNEARSNLKELISQAMEYMPEVMDLTRQSQTDKMINAAAAFMKAAADLNISLSKLSKEIKTVKPSKVVQAANGAEESPVVQHTSVFIGSTEDFLDMLMDKHKAAKEAAKAKPVIDGECEEIET